MTFVPAMWMVWAVLLLSSLILKLYVSRLGRDEDNELILLESSEHLRVEQANIHSKLHKVEPIQRAFLWVWGAASLLLLVYYAHDMVNQFR
jgi:hypothetical protein